MSALATYATLLSHLSKHVDPILHTLMPMLGDILDISLCMLLLGLFFLLLNFVHGEMEKDSFEVSIISGNRNAHLSLTQIKHLVPAYLITWYSTARWKIMTYTMYRPSPFFYYQYLLHFEF